MSLRFANLNKKLAGEWKPPPAILDAFYKLMVHRPESVPEGVELIVAVVCDLFLDHSKKHHCSETFDLYRLYLNQFWNVYGRQPAIAVRPFHFTKWLDGNPKWKASRRHAALAVKRAYTWADKQGVLSPNSLRGLEVEPNNCRTRIFTMKERAEILAANKGEQFREFVLAMLKTGCRPGHCCQCEARCGLVAVRETQTAKKTGKPRSRDRVERAGRAESGPTDWREVGAAIRGSRVGEVAKHGQVPSRLAVHHR
jgi:hypothetical protein